jgi:hypothetical protein
MISDERSKRRPYTPPALTHLGSVRDVTLAATLKGFGFIDGTHRKRRA